MSNKAVCLAAAMSLLLTVGCDKKSEDGTEALDSVGAIEPAVAPAPEPAAPAPPPMEAAVPSQPEALGRLIAIDEHEIAAAEQAKSKGVTGATLEYADLLHEEHTENLAQTKALVNGLVQSAEIDAMKAKGAAELASLAALEGAAYEKAYLEAMAAGHTEAIDAIDNKFIPAATDEAVRTHFTNTRGHVAMHLDEANHILKAAR